MMRRWVIAPVVGALLLASCGGATKEESSLTLVQNAGSAVLAQKTARVEMRFETGGPSLTMDGQIDFVSKRTSFTMDIPGVGVVDLVSDGATLFIRKAGGGWTAITMTGALADQTVQGLGADPRAMLEQLADANGITEKGTERLRGVTTTRYSGSVDFQKALEAQGMPQEQIDQFNEQIKGAGKITSTIDVYLDGDGLAHRTVSRTKLASLMDVTITMDLLDFGAPVNITVPAASEVVRTESASSQFEVNQLTQALVAG